MKTQQPTQAASVQDGRTQSLNQKEIMLNALAAFIRQRPGLEFGNYGDRKSYAAELREITKTRHEAFELLAFVGRSSITAENLLANSRHRLNWNQEEDRWEYTTGQYFPTEYRRAACLLLMATVWDYFRDGCRCDTREKIQAAAKREFSRAVAKRWFQ
jgi:hypothetical protein